MRRIAPLAFALLLAAAPAQEAVRVEAIAAADGSTTLVHEVTVAADAAAVWAAISTPEGWMTWAVPVAWLSADDPDVMETSYDPNDKPGSASTIRQRFGERVPGRRLAFRTIKAPQGFPHWETYRGVASRFELEPAGRQTRVRLISAGYPDTEAGRELITFFRRGNAETLEQLRKRFADGPIDWRRGRP